MSFFKGNYLRVLTPQTIDGINLAYDKQNRPILKETHLPVTALKHLERKNEKLPIQLRKKIELVDVESFVERPAPAKGVSAPEEKVSTKPKGGSKKPTKSETDDTQSNSSL